MMAISQALIGSDGFNLNIGTREHELGADCRPCRAMISKEIAIKPY